MIRRGVLSTLLNLTLLDRFLHARGLPPHATTSVGRRLPPPPGTKAGQLRVQHASHRYAVLHTARVPLSDTNRPDETAVTAQRRRRTRTACSRLPPRSEASRHAQTHALVPSI